MFSNLDWVLDQMINSLNISQKRPKIAISRNEFSVNDNSPKQIYGILFEE